MIDILGTIILFFIIPIIVILFIMIKHNIFPKLKAKMDANKYKRELEYEKYISKYKRKIEEEE